MTDARYEEPDQLAQCQGEVERLKAEKESWVDAGQAVIDSLRSEIERLKTDMRQAAKLNMELMEIRRNNEAEIARLNTLIEEMQVVNAMLPEIVIEERDEARNEVKRLRGLLRECLPYVAAPTGAGDEIWRRVREALEEQK